MHSTLSFADFENSPPMRIIVAPIEPAFTGDGKNRFTSAMNSPPDIAGAAGRCHTLPSAASRSPRATRPRAASGR